MLLFDLAFISLLPPGTSTCISFRLLDISQDQHMLIASALRTFKPFSDRIHSHQAMGEEDKDEHRRKLATAALIAIPVVLLIVVIAVIVFWVECVPRIRKRFSKKRSAKGEGCCPSTDGARDSEHSNPEDTVRPKISAESELATLTSGGTVPNV
jgi:hypothetical protein